MRYNVFRKYANDMFDEYDFMVKRVPKSYYIRLFRNPPALKLYQSLLMHRNDGSHRRRQQPHGRNDGRSSSSDWGSFQVIRKANYNELPLRAWFDCLAIMNWLRHELRCGAWGNSIHGATNCKAISREIMTRKRQFMQSKIANHQ